MLLLQAPCLAQANAYNLGKENSGINFGKWNSRPINKAQAGGLIKDFNRLGLQVTNPACVIQIALKPKWFEGNLTPTVHMKNITDLPRIVWTATGKEALCKELIHAFSGNHQRYALGQYLKIKGRRVKVIQAEVWHLSPKPGETLSVNDPTYIEFQDKQRLLEMLKTQQAVSSLWGVQVYDYSEYSPVFS